MFKPIKITEVGMKLDEGYYTMMVSIDEENDMATLQIGGLSGCFNLSKAQRKKLGNYLLRGLKKK